MMTRLHPRLEVSTGSEMKLHKAQSQRGRPTTATPTNTTSVAVAVNNSARLPLGTIAEFGPSQDTKGRGIAHTEIVNFP
jgi:hypothetical protein